MYNVWCVLCWFELMEDTGADFTMTFRQLSEVTMSQLQTGSIPPVHFHSIHTHSSCNIHDLYNNDFSPLTVTVSLFTVNVGSVRPLITWVFQRLGSAVFKASVKVTLLQSMLAYIRGLKWIFLCFNRLLKDGKWLRCSTSAQNARYCLVYVVYIFTLQYAMANYHSKV